MMTPEALFDVTGPLAMLGWLTLLAWPLARKPLMLIGGYVIPAALSLCYLALILVYWTSAEGSFDTLANVMLLFDTPGTAFAGWVHFLAFDLFIGGWIVRDAARYGIPHLVTWPSLALTLFFGPIGFLLHLTTRGLVQLRATPQTS